MKEGESITIRESIRKKDSMEEEEKGWKLLQRGKETMREKKRE